MFFQRLKGESSSSADEDSRKFNLGPSEKRKSVKLQSVTCTKMYLLFVNC